MTAASSWETCHDRALIAGLMRELYLWNPKIRVSEAGGPLCGEIISLIGLDEPEEGTAKGPRLLRLAVDGDLPSDPILEGDHPDMRLRWRTGNLGPDGAPFPEILEMRRISAHSDIGREIVSVFCRSGALTGPYLESAADHVRDFAESAGRPIEATQVQRFLERGADAMLRGHMSMVRIADSLWLISDIARFAPEEEGGGRRFVGRSILSAAAAVSQPNDTLLLLGWRKGHGFWSDLETFTCEATFETDYTRFQPNMSAPTRELKLTPLGGRPTADAVSKIAMPEGRRPAAMLAGSPRAKAVQIECDGAPVAMALFPGLPPHWSLRRTGNCVWLFPYLDWRFHDRADVYPALGLHRWARGAPGVLEMVSADAISTSTRRLTWRLFNCAQALFFESWTQ